MFLCQSQKTELQKWQLFNEYIFPWFQRLVCCSQKLVQLLCRLKMMSTQRMCQSILIGKGKVTSPPKQKLTWTWCQIKKMKSNEIAMQSAYQATKTHTTLTHIQPVVWWLQRSLLLGLGPPAVVPPSGPPPSESPWPVVSPPPASHYPAGSSAGPSRPPLWLLLLLRYLPQSVWGHAGWCSDTGPHNFSLSSP